MRKNPLLRYSWPMAVLLFAVACNKDLNEINMPAHQRQKPHQDRGFIVMAREGAALDGIAEELSRINAKKFVLKKSFKELGLIHVQTPDPSFPEKARQIAGVEAVAVDVVMNWRLPTTYFRAKEGYKKPAAGGASTYAKGKPHVNLNPLSFLQWDLDAIKAPAAWNKGVKGKGAKVAVLDGGFLLNDSEIAPNIILSHSFIEGEEVQYHGEEGFSHGTHVAGTIAALDDTLGVVGVAPETKLILVKVLDDEGSGPWSSLIDGIFYAVNHDADVINMSLGGELPRRTYTDDNGTPDDPSDDYVVEYDRDLKALVHALNRATLYATLRGTTLIAAAGNDAYNYDEEKDFITYPAAALGVLAISSSGPVGWGFNQDTSLYVPSIFTNHGRKFVSYAAPGGNYSIPLSVDPANVGGIVRPEYVFNFVFNIGGWDEATNEFFYVWAYGTSMAAPHASAAAALLYSRHRFMSPVLVDQIFRRTADDYGEPGKDKFFGNGQINAGRAVGF